MSETKSMSGPCCVCGSTNYALSMGGPTICPKCDCGHFDAGTVLQQAKIIERLRDALEQAVDDFGSGHCVCEHTKQKCIAALGAKPVQSAQSEKIHDSTKPLKKLHKLLGCEMCRPAAECFWPEICQLFELDPEEPAW